MSAQSRVTSRCDVAHSGRENLHQFLPILLWGHALSSSIMTLWLCWNAFIFINFEQVASIDILCLVYWNFCQMVERIPYPIYHFTEIDYGLLCQLCRNLNKLSTKCQSYPKLIKINAFTQNKSICHSPTLNYGLTISVVGEDNSMLSVFGPIRKSFFYKSFSL